MNTKNSRRSIRLKEYDYSQSGGYFVTICSHNNKSLFGTLIDDKIQLNEFGNVVAVEWLRTAELRKQVAIDEYVIMPDHFHGIIMLIEDGRGTACCAFDRMQSPDSRKGTARCAPTIRKFGTTPSSSIPTIVRAFKAAVTRGINLLRKTPGAPVWQRNYYEHVIRNEDDLTNTRKYIKYNPQQIEY